MMTVLVAYLTADLLSGMFHWWEDRYGNPDWPVLGRWIVAPNIEHHQHPRLMCQSTYCDRNATTLVPCAIACVVAWSLECSFAVWVFAFLSQANEVHNWSHQKCSRPVRWLQELGVLQSPRIHAQHHRRPYDANFCVMSNWTNALLEKVRFWRHLEWLGSLMGIRPREDRGAG